MKADTAAVIATKPDGKLPRALTTYLPVDEAIAQLPALRAEAEARGLQVSLRDPSGREVDPATGEPAPPPERAPKPAKPAPAPTKK